MILPLGGGSDDTQRLTDHFRDNSPGRAELGPGRFLVRGISLRGFSCSIAGCNDATIIAALPGQEGPVLDFTGYKYPPGACSTRVIEGFAVEGDGTPGSTKRGVVLGDGVTTNEFGLCGMSFRDISISQTGGCCLDVGASQLSNFERIILNPPILATTNDVPYLRGSGGCNGNLFSRIGFRSLRTSEDCAPSGAAQFTENSSPYTPLQNTFDSWWFEYLHLPRNSCLLLIQGNHNKIKDFQYFDLCLIPGAKETALIRVLAPSGGKENYGGNQFEGYHCGGANGYPNAGVEMHQRSNGVSGIKGKGGCNVRLMPQARYTTVDFLACEQEPKPGDHGVVDQDCKPTTLDGSVTIFDRPNGHYFMGGGKSGATVNFGDGRSWSNDGLYPGIGVKWIGCGGLIGRPNGDLEWIDWVDRNPGTVVKSNRGRKNHG